MESSEQTSAYISSKIYTNRLISGKGAFSHLALSEYANQSHNFASLIVMFFFAFVSLIPQCCSYLWNLLITDNNDQLLVGLPTQFVRALRQYRAEVWVRILANLKFFQAILSALLHKMRL